MGSCRNQLMNEGKPYPKSGCEVCGSILFANKLCALNIVPKPGADPRYYVATQEAEAIEQFKYGVIYGESIHHEGDERSRTNPGHGYPAYTETVQKLETFDTEEKFKAWVKRNSEGYSRKTFKAIKYQELQVETELVVKVK
jgi:hypothetical protein